MSDKEISYDITANGSSFVKSMEQCSAAVMGLGSSAKTHIGSIESVFENLQKRFIAVGAVLAGGKFFKDAITESNKLASEQMHLARRLGLSGEAASALNTALGDIHSDSDTYLGAFEKFAKQIKTNEDGLKAMGLQTRDSNGDLRDSNELFREALAKVGEYKPGLDQTTAAMVLFGKGVDDVIKLQKLNSEVLADATRKNEEYGIAVTKEGIGATNKYKAAMNDLEDIFVAIRNVIAKAVMPVFTQLAEWFSGAGPTAVFAFKVGINLVATALQSVVFVAKTVWNVLRALADPLFTFGDALKKLISGDMNGATEAMLKMGESWGASLSEVFDKISADASRTGEEISNMWGKGTPVETPKSKGNRTMKEGDGKPKDAAKEKAPASDMSVYEQQLAQARTAAAEMDAIRGMSKEAELKFWQDILASSTLKQQDKIAVTKKVEEARLRVLQESAQVAQQLDQISLDTWQQRELAKVEMEAERARQRAAAEEITQETLLEQEAQFEARRQQIRLAYLQSQRASLDPLRDPVQIAQINAQIEGLEQQHQLRMAQIKGQQAQAAAAEQKRIWGDATQRIESLWDKGVESMMNGTFRWRNAQKAVGAELAAWGAGVIKRQVAQWILGEQGKTAATASGTAQRLVMEGWAAAKSVALWAATAVKNIMTSAWEAMASAWKAIVGIPYVGPVLAPIAAGAAFAGVAALAGRVSSAEGGYDIPANVNPLTQLHEKEMVLPAKHADVIRQLADSNFAQANSNQAPVVFQGMGAGDFFIAHKKDLARVMQSMNRNFAFK